MRNYIQPFEFQLPSNLVYELEAVKNRLSSEINFLNISKALVVTDKGIVRAGLLGGIETSLKTGNIKYNVFDEVEPNPSTETCCKCCEIAKSMKAGVIIALGGGSPMDVAKAAAAMATNEGELESYEGIANFQNDPLPIIAIPTTTGTGSEVTPFIVITILQRHYKMTIVSKKIIPKIALLDPTILTTMPTHIAASTGIDALVHAIESYINLAASPASEAFATSAIRMIGKYLRSFTADRNDIEAAAGMIVASTLAGVSFGVARLGNVHAMAHPLGGFFDLPHGVANAILLPHVMRFNMLADNGKYKRIASLLGEDVFRMTGREAAPLAIDAVEKLCSDVNIPKTLSEVGITADKIPQMAKDAMLSGNVKINPRATTEQDIINLYHAAM